MVHSVADITPNGSATAIASSRTPCNWLIVSAPSGNTGAIRVGDSSVSASRGAIVEKGFSTTLWAIGDTQYLDLAQVYVFGASGSDKCGILYGTH